MDKQTFSSIQATTNTSRYAAAVFHKGNLLWRNKISLRLAEVSSIVMWWAVIDVLVAGELHLTPLQGILQMRPSFTYLDKADTKHREREAANEGQETLFFTSDLILKSHEREVALVFSSL